MTVQGFKKAVLNPYVIIALSGILLNISFFIHNIYAQIFALFIVAPTFFAISRLKGIKRYVGGLIFFGSWIIPTCYWYFLIFPWWAALLRLTIFTLMANVFFIPLIIKKRNIVLDFVITIVLWVGIIAARIELPFTEDWWIPHIAYTQLLNPLIVQIGGVTGIYGIILIILFINAAIAYLLTKKKYIPAGIVVIIVIATCLTGNILFQNTIGQGDKNIALIAVQSVPSKGFYSENATVEDIENLKSLTAGALKDIERKENNIVIVLWPENMVKTSEDENISQFVRENNIYLVYNRAEPNEDELPFNTAVLLDSNGEAILTNYKKHIAPGEEITSSNEFSSVMVHDIKVVTDICYDLHYPDIREGISGDDLLLAPVDDDRFGSFFPYLHAADTVFRAVENDINIITASTNGPTFYVNRYGVVERMPLPVYSEDVLMIETKI
ncbi:MAG: hypothetical protein ISS14_00615 [Actinobacteria bacterium]|nr:hypothetical protein [Actinomycetota bacterium]MBL7123382.1 hypothetical protein [Actinomycetota bacterium]